MAAAPTPSAPLVCQKCQEPTTMSCSSATGRNPLLRACNGCLATERWLTRASARPKVGKTESEQDKERRVSALQVKEDLKQKTPEEKAQWYQSQKLQRAQEEQSKKRTFSSAVGSVEDIREKQNISDDVESFVTFRTWAQQELTLKTFSTLAEAKVAWEKKIKDPNTRTMQKHGETLMYEFRGVELRGRDSHGLRAGLRQRMDIGSQEDLDEYHEESGSRMKRARQRLDIETAAKFEAGEAELEKPVPLLTVSKDIGQLKEIEESRDEELFSLATKVAAEKKAQQALKKEELEKKPKSLPLEKLAFEAARKKAIQSMSDVGLRLRNSLTAQDTELEKTLETESQDLRDERSEKVKEIDQMLASVQEAMQEKDLEWKEWENSTCPEDLAVSREKIQQFIKSYHTAEPKLKAVKDKLTDLRLWHGKLKKSINDREKAAAKTSANKKLSGGEKNLALLAADLCGCTLEPTGSVDYSYIGPNLLKKNSPLVFEKARSSQLTATIRGLEYYRLQKSWVAEKMKSANTSSCTAMISKKPVVKKLGDVLLRSWSEIYGGAEERACLTGVPEDMKDHFVVQFGQRMKKTCSVLFRTDLNLPTLVVVLEGRLTIGGFRQRVLKGSTEAEKAAELDALKAPDVQALLGLQLHAAFDGREEAAELIEVFMPGINRDGKYQRADVLVTWARENESAIKRQRRESLHGMWEVLPQQRVVPKLTDTFDELARSNPLVLLPALQRKRRLLKENTDATQRAKEEQLAKKKYALQLAGILKEAKLPLVQQLEGVDQPEEVWPRIFGTRRSKTLRNRLKAWQPFRTWLQCVHDAQWPTSVRQLIDYSNERFQSECGKTVLNSFQASLAVLEQVGKVAETQRLSSDTTWLAHLKSLTADLVGEQAPVQQAPMMTVAMIISLELHIAREDEPEYVRAMAFVALLAVYGSMRMDDLQGMLPATMRLTAQGFRATLGRTKTTGVDRRNKEVTVFIHRQAGLSGFDWLGEGFALWKKYTQPRDYLVMTARDDWKGPTKHFAKSEVVAGYVREVFKRLATPKFQDGAYRLNLQRYLLVEGAQGFFTGHSPRNWLTSAAAVLGWTKDQRDFLGRWLIGGSGSADYTRTSREVVHRIQIGVCRAIVTGQGGEYQEIEALEELKAYVDERGGSGALARRRHDILRTVGGARCLGNKWPVIELDDADASEEEEAAEAMTVEGIATKYFISISRKTGHRRLHLNGMKEDQGSEEDQADQRAEVAKMDSDLQYVLQEASASLATQYQVARLHQSRRRFQAIADNREGARTAARDFGINPDTPAGRVEVAAIVAAWELAKEYASKEVELRAEAKVLGHKRILQVQERQAMLKAVTDAYGKMNESETPSAEYLATKAEECESNEPLASSLDRISSKKDSQVESLQTSIDPTGHVRVTKTMQKLEMPHHSEGYRRLMKVEAHAWLCMSARFKAKAWLQGLQLEDFTRFVEYILGDRVGNLKLPTASGQETQFNRFMFFVLQAGWQAAALPKPRILNLEAASAVS
ncbi:unnamed protein product [Symbiodinium sp. CCMP2592]|nr:unnamed protein product [Symbiodinium sp. CCMP2592]